MLSDTCDIRTYKEVFTKKMLNFAKKAPIMMSFVITVQKGQEGVLISHTNSDTKYFFPFDFSKQVKDYIADIKRILVAKHYPRIVDEVLERHELTQEELAKSLETGKSIDDLQKYELRKMGERQYRIDKFLSWRDTFILILENSTFKQDENEIGKAFLYKMNTSAVLFLRRYRQNGFGGLNEASRFFFDNAVLIRVLNDEKQEDEEQPESAS
jgi:hypothetical protein